MRDWLSRHGIDRRPLIWLVILLALFPILLAVMIFSPLDVQSGDPSQTIGYSMVAFLIGAGLALLYMAVIGLPLAALCWIGVFALLRRMGLGPRASATLSGGLASVAMMLPAALRIGGGSTSRTIGVMVMLGLIPCIISIIYFLITYRSTTWDDLNRDHPPS
ncbi:hypothetical protein [uncultured Paracoccus sp.]|uniref:hypothetical protein n=1 Tax=uncultured Paracoccus sp. TaxID=189685 RepID=UPI00261741C3|nr:hypothetical protein [uncultured Paracoccus sp.]